MSAVDRTIALADYAPPLDRVLISLKFGKQLALARPLGILLMQQLLHVAGMESTTRPSSTEPDAEPDTNSGVNPRTGRGVNRGVNPGENPDVNPDVNPGVNLDVTPDMNLGTNPWPDPGTNLDMDLNVTPGTNPDAVLGADLGAVLGIDLLVPIPLSGRRLAVRGFNQSLQIARGMKAGSRRCPPLCHDGLIRIRHTAPQSTLNAEARQQNLRGAFAVPNPQRVAGRRVALVDDVMTTGSTLEEAARTLKAAGARAVIALVVTRTPE